MALIDDVKLVLRISGAASDAEVTDLISAAEADLALSGIYVDETDALIKRAIGLYCKANFGYDNPEADRFHQIYENLKAHLSATIDYSTYAVVFTVKSSNVALDEATVTFNGVTKTTGATGTVTFYVIEGLNYEYTITKSGYAAQSANIDISAATTINISLVVV